MNENVNLDQVPQVGGQDVEPLRRTRPQVVLDGQQEAWNHFHQVAPARLGHPRPAAQQQRQQLFGLR